MCIDTLKKGRKTEKEKNKTKSHPIRKTNRKKPSTMRKIPKKSPNHHALLYRFSGQYPSSLGYPYQGNKKVV